MLTPQESTRYRRDLRRMGRRGKDLEKLKAVVRLLAAEQSLPERHRDHHLGGGFDHGVGHPLLLLYDTKAPHGQNSM